MIPFGIDLKAIVLLASKAGADLTLTFESHNEIVLRMERKGFRVCSHIFPWQIESAPWCQSHQFENEVKRMIYELDKAEEKLIETGGVEQ